MYPPLREKGYNEKFSTGVLTSSGAIAIVIPPSISMILYGASAEQSVSHLFIAGIFPGLLMSLMMGGYIYWYAARRDIREGQPFNMGEFLRTSEITETRAFVRSFVKAILVRPGQATMISARPPSRETPRLNTNSPPSMPRVTEFQETTLGRSIGCARPPRMDMPKPRIKSAACTITLAPMSATRTCLKMMSSTNASCA